MTTNSWILPDGINEVLAPNGWRLEQLRRNVLDMYQAWGYELVIPPIVEHLDSLLTGTGKQLNLQTFKMTDLVSGRLIGLRADITPQIARIDASQNHDSPSRYCYVGTVLHTRAFDFNGVRDPLQVGVELFGHKGLTSDLEIISLMLKTLELANVNSITLDLGHIGIVKSLLKSENLSESTSDSLFSAINRKSSQEIEMICDEFKLDTKKQLLELINCNGEQSIIKDYLSTNSLTASINDKIKHLLALGSKIESNFPNVNIVYDLAELKGYQYHTGVIFSAYVNSMGKEIARGGRYDEIGKAFGKYRPATGFSTDLKTLMDFYAPQLTAKKVIAPDDSNEDLKQFIKQLREQGEQVVQSFAGSLSAKSKSEFTHSIQLINNQWQLIEEAHGE